jgi:hypothetical protein
MNPAAAARCRQRRVLAPVGLTPTMKECEMAKTARMDITKPTRTPDPVRGRRFASGRPKRIAVASIGLTSTQRVRNGQG